MLTIGEFSRVSHVSARMLRHYDAIGLLRPAHTGAENGYRYYDTAQLATLIRIEALKGYGFTLAQIPALLALSQQELAMRIHARRLAAYETLHTLRKSIRRMEQDILTMEGTNMALDQYHVIVMETQPQRVFGIRKTISIAQVCELFDELLSEMGKRGLRRAGATQMLYLDEEFSYEKMDVEAQVQVAGEHADVKEVPAQQCVAVTHNGPYDTIRYAYDAICKWLAGHPEYKVCGAPIERYIKDEDTVASPEEFVTGVLFPVTKQ